MQVARVSNGKALDEELIQRIASHIQSQLQLKNDESLLDVCCGNGLLLSCLKPHCREATGIDFSEALIGQAIEKYSAEQLQFLHLDATQFNLKKKFDKVLLYFSFQYFESYETGKLVIENLLKHAKPGALILIGDIPDKSRWFQYYNSFSKWLTYTKQYYRNANDMGKFWHEKELLSICDELGVKGEKQVQESWQPYSHYRFDFRIQC